MNYLLIALLIYILWRLVMGFPGAGKKSRGNDKAGDSGLLASEELVQDPVCGIYIPKNTALKAKQKGKMFYFCGKECQKTFLQKK